MAHRTRSPAPTPRKFSGKYAHRTITGGIGHNSAAGSATRLRRSRRRSRWLCVLTVGLSCNNPTDPDPQGFPFVSQ